MSIRNTKLGGTDWTNGEVLEADDINDTFNASGSEIFEVYTGTGFDSSQTGAGTDEEDHELTAIPANRVNKYVKIKILGRSFTNSSSGYYGIVSLKIQTKETGESYSDKLAYVKVLQSGGSDSNSLYCTSTFEWVYEPTDDEIANGFQIKLFSKSFATNASAITRATFTNIQTVIELL